MIKLESPVLASSQELPRQYTGEGANISPPLRWDNIPPNARELALIVEDPDAPSAQESGEPFVHWVLYKIPASVTSLPERVATKPMLKNPKGAMQGKNDFGDNHYDGPKPPDDRPHHYRFTLYALDTPIRPNPAMDKKEFMSSLQGHILDKGELVATYQRRNPPG